MTDTRITGKPWLIYGATGYTGGLIAARAVRRGLAPTLAGRNADKVRAVAEPLGLPWTAFQVDDPAAVDAALTDMGAVLSVAGPFSATARQMIAGCLRNRTHYLDVTGEIDVFNHALGLDGDARAAGIALIPGVGFDVVPSDCLALHTARRVAKPTGLRLAINVQGGMSRGTAKTGVETLGYGTFIRKGGKLVSRPVGSVRRDFDFGTGPKPFVAVSWGDVATAHFSTGIPDIEVYFPYGGPIKHIARASRLLGPLLRLKGFQNFLKRRIDAQPPGPDADERAHRGAELLAEVTGADGTVARSMLTTPNGYSLTAESAVSATLRLMSLEGVTGYHTPATAFGNDFVTSLPGCHLRDL